MGITTIATKPVRVAVASLAGLGIAGGIAVAADAATGTIKTSGANLTVRKGPGTGYAAVGTIAKGTKVTISCQTTGSTVKGTYGTSNIWDKIGTGRFVSDAYVYTGSDGRVAPKCGSTGGSTGSTTPSGIIGNDYPYSGQTSGVDPWNFYKGQCTSFAAWRARSVKHVSFTNSYKGQHWGNANHWDDAARAAGVTTSSRPHVGDIAQSDAGSYGHVAYVAKVNANGSFVVEEYNWANPEHYGTRTTTVGGAHGQFDTFIRF